MTDSLSNLEKGKYKVSQSKSIKKSIAVDLLDILDLDNKIVDRNQLAKTISINRYENGNNEFNSWFPSWKINIKWRKELVIDEAKYWNIIWEYKKLIDQKPTDYEKRLEELDSILAERIILDTNNMIEFKYWDKFDWDKSPFQEAKIAYKELSKLDEYKGKISLLSKKNGRFNDYFIILLTQEDINKIKPQNPKEEVKEDEVKEDEVKENKDQEPEDAKESLDPEKEKLKEENKELKEKLDKLEKELAEIKELLKKLNDEKEKKEWNEDKEENKESIEKVNEITWNLDNQDINYKKDMKKKVEETLRIWWTLILVKWSSQIARLEKIDDKWFKCITCTDDKLNALIDKSFYIIENRNKSYISYIKNTDLRDFINFDEEIIPKPTPPEPKPEPEDDEDDKLEYKDIDLSAVISDMWTDVHRERVSLETEEELKEEYKNTSKWNVGKRAYLFLSRWAKRKRLNKEKMEKLSWKAFSGDDSLDDKTINAADRHELELLNKLENIDKANSTVIKNVDINDLCKDFLLWSVTEADFKIKFNQIIDADANIQNVLKWKKISHIWTNILEKLKLQKANFDLINLVNSEFNSYVSASNNIHIDNINKAIEDYINKFQKTPEFMWYYQDFLNKTQWSKEKLEKYLKHQKAIMKMQITNLKLNLDILIWWKSAYQIDNKDRQKWIWYKVWKALDKLPRRAQTAWFVSISIGTWLLTWWLSTVAAAAITTWVSAWSIWWLNALKKWTHYTKEQNTHEKNIVTDNKAEKERIEALKALTSWEKRYKQKWFKEKRKVYKAGRQLKLYNEATQQDFQITDTITQSIMSEASKISWMDKTKLEGDLTIWLARLDYYREVWHNFLASENKEKIESDFNKLEKAIILGLQRLWTDLDAFRQKPEIWKLKDTLKTDYDKSFKNFKKERIFLSSKYWLSTAALSAWISVGMQRITWSWLFSDKAVDWVAATNFTDNTTDTFDLWKAELLDTATRNDLYNTWSSILKDPNVIAWSEITINYWAWTDATAVIPWRLTEAVYQSKIDAVLNNINLLNLDWASKDMLIEHVKSQPWQSSRETSNFMNDYLHGMRCAEAVEQLAKSVADSGRTDIVLNLNYDSTLDIVWQSVKDASERAINANFVVNTPEIPWVAERSRWRFLQFPVFFNTFKDRLTWEDKKPNEPKTPEKDKEEKIEKPNSPKEREEITNKKKYRDDFWDKNKEKPNLNPIDPWIKKDPKTWKLQPIEDISKKKIWVSTRKEKVERSESSFLDKDWIRQTLSWYKDIADFSPEYPNKFWEKSLDEIATEVIDNPNIPLYKDSKYQNDSTQVENLIAQWKRQEAIQIIKWIIIKEREYIQKEQEEKYNRYISEIYSTIQKAFKKYWVKDLENTLPSKDKIHILSWYEFWAYQKPRVSQEWKMTWWVCYTDHWHILINHDAIHMYSDNPQQQENILKDILVHELIHDSWVNNYHHFYKLRDKSKSKFDKANRKNENFIVRRIWLKIIKRLKWNSFFVYWTAINEAVTQMLADEIWKSKYDWAKSLLPETYQSNAYPREKEIIALLQKKFDIPFDTFAKAILNRTRDDDKGNNYLRIINEKVNWRTSEWLLNVSYKRPEMLKLIMCIMDYESQPSVKDFSDEYKLTKALINGEQLVITPEMKKYFHPGLLKDWILKPELQSAYTNLLDQESKATAA